MNTENTGNSLGFNVEYAKKCAKLYSDSMQVRCIIIDTRGNTIYCDELCSFCKSIAKSCEYEENCRNAHLYGSYQAERFGGKYVFFCPLGLVHWASPVICDGAMKGALVAGPVHMVEPEDFLLDEILEKNNLNMEKIKSHMDEIPVLKPERVNNLSEMLFMITAHISDINPLKYMEERESQEQQADISEYMQYIETMGGDDTVTNAYPIEKEKELLSAITLGDKQVSQKLLNEILGHIFFSTGRDFEIIKARVLELVVLLSRAALKGGADVEQIFGLNYKYLNQIHGFKTVEDMTNWLSKIMTRFTDCVFNLKNVKHVDVIYRAVDYIKRNYMKKITLDNVAEHVYLCPSYFSKVFKEEMKFNFNKYLNNIRIEKSKALLLNESIPLVDISNIVGYEDQSYFSKVFKKLTGVSPGKYRESRGKLVLDD